MIDAIGEGGLQVHETFMVFLTICIPLVERMLFWDLSTNLYKMEVRRAPECPCCGNFRV